MDCGGVEEVSLFVFALGTPARKTHMQTATTKPKLRTAFVSALTSFALALSIVSPAAAATPYATTVNFLASSFGENKNSIELFGSRHDGVTLESMIQLKAAGRNLVQQLPAVRYMLIDQTQVLGKSSSGYIFNADKSLKVGLAGKFLYTSEILGVANNSMRYSVFTRLKAKINSSGEIAGTASGAVDYAWVALGLYSYDEDLLANKVVSKMLSLQNADGGFSAWDPSASNIDGTGLVLQALNLPLLNESSTLKKNRVNATKLAVAYLTKSVASEGDHWDADGAPSVNSTAYAAMGLKAAKKKISKYSSWLKTQLATGGGFTSAFSNGAADVFATSQAIAPLIGINYLDLLK